MLKLLANQARVSPFNMVVATAIIAYLIYGYIPHAPWVLATWLGLVIASQAYRRHRLLQLPQEHARPAKARTREAAVIQLACTAILAFGILCFPLLSPFEAALMTMFYLAMGVGSIVAVLGWPPYVRAHLWGHLIPLFILWLWSGYAGPAGTAGYLCGLIGLLYSVSMRMFSRGLFRMNEEFFANRAALADALKDAEKANDAKSRFLAAASHDLRQPVHTMSLLNAALKRRPLDESTRSITDTMQDAVSTLSGELDALLDISKLDAGVVPVARKPILLADLLQRICGELQERAAEVDIRLLVDCDPELAVTTDSVLLERILRNLLENAVAHAGPCDVTVSAGPLRDQVVLEVVDTGRGVSPEESRRVFEEFYQVYNPERDKSRGLGLGLSIVQRLAQLLELEMEFSSQPQLGTRFRFHLPAGDVVPARADPVPGKADLEGLRVLVVDDEHSVRIAMSSLLQSLGCLVATADSLEGAMRELRGATQDIALVDLRLRNRESGIDAVVALRAEQANLAAVIISGDTAPERLREVEAAGLHMLHKPATEESLHLAIARALAAVR